MCVCDVRCVCLCVPERVCVCALCVGVGVGVGAWAHSPGVGVRACNVGVRAHGGCALRETDVGAMGLWEKTPKNPEAQQIF